MIVDEYSPQGTKVELTPAKEYHRNSPALSIGSRKTSLSPEAQVKTSEEINNINLTIYYNILI